MIDSNFDDFVIGLDFFKIVRVLFFLRDVYFIISYILKICGMLEDLVIFYENSKKLKVFVALFYDVSYYWMYVY